MHPLVQLSTQLPFSYCRGLNLFNRILGPEHIRALHQLYVYVKGMHNLALLLGDTSLSEGIVSFMNAAGMSQWHICTISDYMFRSNGSLIS